MLRNARTLARVSSAALRVRAMQTTAAALKDKRLFTPGPLCTTETVKREMLRDLGSRDVEFVKAVKDIRAELLAIAGVSSKEFTTVLQQGSGTFAVESVLTTSIPRGGTLLAIANGAYGHRICALAGRFGDVKVIKYECEETETPDLKKIEDLLRANPAITNVAVVHCETSSGVINPVTEIGKLVKKVRPNASYFIDAMSSFGAIALDFNAANADYVVSSANKCIEGVPGFGYALCRLENLLKCKGNARSVSLDLYDQYQALEGTGQFRFTPATHTMLAFRQALREYVAQGGLEARRARYAKNKAILQKGMDALGFQELLPRELSNANIIITSYALPKHPKFNFAEFYERLNKRDLVIYPGKVTKAECFRIGNIGQIFPEDMEALLKGIKEVCAEMGVELPLKK